MKHTELQVFANNDLGEIKGFADKHGDLWFLAGSVCRSLGLKDSGRQVKSIQERFKIAGVKGLHTMRPLLESPGGSQKTLFISEQVLYELIFQSRKQKAIKFRAWVTNEVLPEIRKHGSYRMDGKLIRRNLTDAIKQTGEDERMHGHAYSNYSRMINRSLGLPSKVNRNELSADMLEKIAKRENLVQALLQEGAEYYEIKAMIEDMATGKLEEK